MSMTPEGRAEWLSMQLLGLPNNSTKFHALIAQAIRQAQDDKLEEAARLCDGVTEVLTRRQQKHASPYFAMVIRNLKHKDT